MTTTTTNTDNISNSIDIAGVEREYIECALWSSVDDDGDPLDLLGIEALALETRSKMSRDVADFVLKNQALLKASNLTAEDIGHCFWLNRNRHGSGFWDRDLGAIGDMLDDACKVYPPVDLYVGDDGEIHH